MFMLWNCIISCWLITGTWNFLYSSWSTWNWFRQSLKFCLALHRCEPQARQQNKSALWMIIHCSCCGMSWQGWSKVCLTASAERVPYVCLWRIVWCPMAVNFHFSNLNFTFPFLMQCLYKMHSVKLWRLCLASHILSSQSINGLWLNFTSLHSGVI